MHVMCLSVNGSELRPMVELPSPFWRPLGSPGCSYTLLKNSTDCLMESETLEALSHGVRKVNIDLC